MKQARIDKALSQLDADAANDYAVLRANGVSEADALEAVSDAGYVVGGGEAKNALASPGESNTGNHTAVPGVQMPKQPLLLAANEFPTFGLTPEQVDGAMQLMRSDAFVEEMMGEWADYERRRLEEAQRNVLLDDVDAAIDIVRSDLWLTKDDKAEMDMILNRPRPTTASGPRMEGSLRMDRMSFFSSFDDRSYPDFDGLDHVRSIGVRASLADMAGLTHFPQGPSLGDFDQELDPTRFLEPDGKAARNHARLAGGLAAAQELGSIAEFLKTYLLYKFDVYRNPDSGQIQVFVQKAPVPVLKTGTISPTLKPLYHEEVMKLINGG